MTPEEEQFLPPEYLPNVLVVMAKGSRQGLWRANGGEVLVAALDIPGPLAERLGQWSRTFSDAARDETAANRQTILSTFSQEGLVIAREVQGCLGDAYEVLYFDEARLEAEAYLTDYLYPAGHPVCS